MSNIEITIPMPPSANHSHTKSRFPKAETVAWRKYVAEYLKENIKTKFTGNVYINLELCFRESNKKRGDYRNRYKEIDDILQGYAYDNDFQIVLDEGTLSIIENGSADYGDYVNVIIKEANSPEPQPNFIYNQASFIRLFDKLNAYKANLKEKRKLRKEKLKAKKEIQNG